MLLLRTVLLTVAVVVCAAPFCAAQWWPCPNPSDILPCVCTASDSFELVMDCSNVISSDQLRDVFQTPFTFNDFKQLIINPVTPNTGLVDLPVGVFGPVTFQEIDIMNTYINTVKEETLVNSHDTLWRLNLASNKIHTFPIETLELYTALLEFYISNNKISGTIPDIVSKTLITLDMSDNIGMTLTTTTFQYAPLLQVLLLNNMNLGDTTPPHAFHNLTHLKTLSLRNNNIPGTLIENLIDPMLNPLITLSLNGNEITQIHPDAITGMNAEGFVTFIDNGIEYLCKENWQNLVSQLSNANAIDVRDNPLVCGCDVNWLVFDTDLMRIFDSSTMCAAGIYLVDLPHDWFLEHCPASVTAEGCNGVFIAPEPPV